MFSEDLLVRDLGRHYARALKTRLRRGVWRRPPSAAFDLDDLVQDTLLRALSRRDDSSGDDPIRDVGRYLEATARNILCDRARASRREARLSEAVTCDRAVPRPGLAAPDDMVGYRSLRRHLDHLPTEIGEVFRERYVLQNSARQAAINLAIPHHTLRRRERQLIGELRALLMLTRSELREKRLRRRNRQRTSGSRTSG
jgi:RNA polymerase sigma factor (sigma-70 family)